MRPRTTAVIAGTAVVVLIGATGGVYAYDSSRSDLIADGVRVSGVDVGGLTAGAAREKLEGALLEPLREPVTVRHGDRRFRLSAERAKVTIDLDASVARALDTSRDGSLLTRFAREVTGDRLDTEVPVDIDYSRGAIRRLVDRVARRVDRPAQDARVSFTGGKLDTRRSRAGIEVRKAWLRREIDERLLRAEGSRSIRVRVKRTQPKVTTAELAREHPVHLLVDRSNHRLTLYKRLEKVKTYGIAVGQVGLETPAGLYKIQNKAVDPAWNVPNSDWAGSLAGQVIPGGAPNNPLKSRWMGIYDGVGIHGTSDDASIGTNASHGCIRMHVWEVEELYEQVPVGAPVYIL